MIDVEPKMSLRIMSPWRLHVCDTRNCKTSPTDTRGELLLSPYTERLKSSCWREASKRSRLLLNGLAVWLL